MTSILEFLEGNFVTGAFGAFFGALAAFLFERWKAGRDLADSRYSSVLHAQLALSYHINSLENFKRKYLDPYKDLPNRALLIPIFHQAENSYAVDVNALCFLLEGKNPNILMEIYLADRAYGNAFLAARIRSEKLADFQATAEMNNFDTSSGIGQVTISPPVYKLLSDVTDAMFNRIETAIKSNKAAFDSLRSQARSFYPKRKLLDLGIIDA